MKPGRRQRHRKPLQTERLPGNVAKVTKKAPPSEPPQGGRESEIVTHV